MLCPPGKVLSHNNTQAGGSLRELYFKYLQSWLLQSWLPVSFPMSVTVLRSLINLNYRFWAKPLKFVLLCINKTAVLKTVSRTRAACRIPHHFLQCSSPRLSEHRTSGSTLVLLKYCICVNFSTWQLFQSRYWMYQNFYILCCGLQQCIAVNLNTLQANVTPLIILAKIRPNFVPFFSQLDAPSVGITHTTVT